MATIYTADLTETITDGLQGCNTCDEALTAARRIAADTGEPVALEDDDGLWIVTPTGSCIDHRRYWDDEAMDAAASLLD